MCPCLPDAPDAGAGCDRLSQQAEAVDRAEVDSEKGRNRRCPIGEMGSLRRHRVGDRCYRRVPAPDQRDGAGGNRGAVEASRGIDGRREDASRFGADDRQRVIRRHARFDAVDSLEGCAGFIPIYPGKKMDQGGTAVRAMGSMGTDPLRDCMS